MNTNEYQDKALRTAGSRMFENERMTLGAKSFYPDALMNCALGLSGESGEVADIIKKATFQGHDYELDKIKEELGDVLWYVALGATAMNVDLSEIMEENIAKLERRYPDGFDELRSLNR